MEANGMEVGDPVVGAARHSAYHGQVRAEILPLLPAGRGLDVLEIGCGYGATGARLKSLGVARHVTGVELDPLAAKEAERVLDRVETGDFEALDLGDGRRFHLVLALDVLEHLVDPWRAVSTLAGLLRPGGHLITSTPNIRFWRVLYDLSVGGRFDYQDDGIMDRTHLRFFTRRSIVALHESAGLEVETVVYPPLAGKRGLLDRATGGRARDLLSGQHLVRSRARG